MTRYSLRANLDQKLSKYVKMGINLTATRNEYDNVPLGSGRMRMPEFWFLRLSLIRLCPFGMRMAIFDELRCFFLAESCFIAGHYR